MANRHTARIKRLENKMMLNGSGMLIVQTEYGETNEEAIARVKQENPDFNENERGLIFVINYANARIPDIDNQIKAEESKIIELEKRKTKKTARVKKKKTAA